MFLLKIRNRHFFLLDAIFLLVTPTVALALRTDTYPIAEGFLPALAAYTLVGLLLRLALFYLFGLYQRFWRYASIDELTQIAMAVLVSTAILTAIFIIARSIFSYRFPRSLPLIDALLLLLTVGGSRFSVRVAMRHQRLETGADYRRVLVMGAGDAGAIIVREIHNSAHVTMQVIGFLDDDKSKHDMQIHGVPVLGARQDIPDIVRKYQIDHVIIAMPTAPGKIIRGVIALCEEVGVDTKIMPGLYELLDGRVSVNQLRDVALEDLLRREPVKTDIAAVSQLLEGKRVLITGGGGSIGSELCRQVMRCAPAELVILGHGENSVFNMHRELSRLNAKKTQFNSVIADIRFADRIEGIFAQYQPQVVFHAAAHKHVSLMERNPAEAITNNVLGTRNLLRAAQQVNVEHFVMISTDKAVNPTSMMGASKRAAELLVHQAAAETNRSYVAVRFGNVLGSRGSVVPIFEQQIAQGGPVTVTDPEMKRFFMTIPEAVQLVLQAAVLGQGGEVFVLDMGEPVKIVDMARDLIELSGLQIGRDIDIVFIGPKPGEKLFEELFISGEDYQRTTHEKIFIAGNASRLVPDCLNEVVDELARLAHEGDESAIWPELMKLVPEFKPQNGRLPLESSTTTA